MRGEWDDRARPYRPGRSNVADLCGMSVAAADMSPGTHPFAFDLICLASPLVYAVAALLLYRRKLL